MKAYSAGLMSQSFWFIEFKKIVKLVSDGKSQNDIKAACVEENLLGAVIRTAQSGSQVISRTGFPSWMLERSKCLLNPIWQLRSC